MVIQLYSTGYFTPVLLSICDLDLLVESETALPSREAFPCMMWSPVTQSLHAANLEPKASWLIEWWILGANRRLHPLGREALKLKKDCSNGVEPATSEPRTEALNTKP